MIKRGQARRKPADSPGDIMHIAAIALGGMALSWAFWHLAYLAGGHAQRDLEIAERLRRTVRGQAMLSIGRSRTAAAVSLSSKFAVGGGGQTGSPCISNR